jgi:hypothetical protein
MKKSLISICILLLAGCAGRQDYFAPSLHSASTMNSIIIDKSRDDVWNSSIPALGKEFFVINNLDKSFGFMNISYSGDHIKFIDCGRVISYVKNLQGERNYDFPGATANMNYEVMNDRGLFIINRKMSLEGRANLIFENEGKNKTRITVNTRYVVNRTITARNAANNFPFSRTDSISFNTGGTASFPEQTDGRATSCVPTGAFEKDILTAIK